MKLSMKKKKTFESFYSLFAFSSKQKKQHFVWKEKCEFWFFIIVLLILNDALFSLLKSKHGMVHDAPKTFFVLNSTFFAS